MEEANNIVVLNDENGNEIEFEFVDLIKYQDQDYVVLLPVGDDGDDGEVVILQVEAGDEDGEEETYISVEDDAVLEAVFEIFKERFKDEFDFAE
jgi:uncharacterized protein YrzB (UPF0473 family)